MIPKYSDLSTTQHRVIRRLAEAEISDPPGWVSVYDMRAHDRTLKSLARLDLLVVSPGDGDTRAKITSRGVRYYEEVLSVPRKDRATRYTESELRQIIQRGLDGERYPDIAKDFGCTKEYVSYLLRGNGKRAPKILQELGADAQHIKPEHPKARKRQVLRLRKQGRTYEEISEITGVPFGTIGHWLRDSGLTTKRWLSHEEKSEIVRLVVSGMSHTKVAALLGCSRRPISDTMKAYYRGAFNPTEGNLSQ